MGSGGRKKGWRMRHGRPFGKSTSKEDPTRGELYGMQSSDQVGYNLAVAYYYSRRTFGHEAALDDLRNRVNSLEDTLVYPR